MYFYKIGNVCTTVQSHIDIMSNTEDVSGMVYVILSSFVKDLALNHIPREKIRQSLHVHLRPHVMACLYCPRPDQGVCPSESVYMKTTKHK